MDRKKIQILLFKHPEASKYAAIFFGVLALSYTMNVVFYNDKIDTKDISLAATFSLLTIQSWKIYLLKKYYKQGIISLNEPEG